MAIPIYLPLSIVAGCIATLAAVIVGANQALKRSNWAETERRPTIRTLLAVLVGWFLIASALAFLGVYQGASRRFPTIEFGIVIPILAGCFGLAPLRWTDSYHKTIIVLDLFSITSFPFATKPKRSLTAAGGQKSAPERIAIVLVRDARVRVAEILRRFAAAGKNERIRSSISGDLMGTRYSAIPESPPLKGLSPHARTASFSSA
jgi:hypothetical protein